MGYCEVDVVKNRIVDNVNLKYPPSVFDTIGLVSTICFEIIYTFLKILPFVSSTIAPGELLQRKLVFSDVIPLSWCSWIEKLPDAWFVVQYNLSSLKAYYESPLVFFLIYFKYCWLHRCIWFQPLSFPIAVVGHTYRGDAEAEEHGIWFPCCVEAGCSFSSPIHNNEYANYEFPSHACWVSLELSYILILK